MKTFIKSLIFSIVISLTLVAQVNFLYAQTAGLLLNGVQQFFDNNGNPLSQGTVSTYIPGTFTNKTTWQNQGQTAVNTNPIVLDAAGRATIYGVGTYRQIVKDKNGNQIWDAVTQPGGVSVNQLLVGDGQPVGTIRPWAGVTVPAQYMYAAGQTLSRNTYVNLLQVITIVENVNCTTSSAVFTGIADTTQIQVGSSVEIPTCLASPSTVSSKTSNSVTLADNSLASTTVAATFFPYGDGDGSTTFTLPDLRGVVLAGRPNMGGSIKGNLTSTYYGIDPNGLNAIGGSQSNTIAQTNLPNVNFTVSGITLSNGAVTATANVGINNGDAPAQAFSVSNPPAATGINLVSSTNLAIATNVTVNTQGSAASGGSGTAFAIIQPTSTINYIIKVLPDTNLSSGAVVTSVNTLIGDINLVAGGGVTITPSGQNLTIAASVSSTSFVPGTTAITGATAPCFLLNTTGTTSACDALGTGVTTAMSHTVNASSGLLTFGIIGTSGSTLCLVNTNCAFSGVNSHSALETFSGGITGLPAPSNASDAATKIYVDNTAQGLTIHPSVVLATTTALAANTYNNGSSGVGATLTANSNGNLVIDGITNPVATTRILVKNEVTAANNGIYVVTTTGGASQAYVLTRATDANTAGTQDPTKIGIGSYALITSGTANTNSSWIVTSTVTTIGTSAINWSQFGAAFNGVTSISSTGSLTFSASVGAVTGDINLAHSNIWTGTQTITNNGSNLFLDTPSSAQISALALKGNGTSYWTIAKGTANDFELFDAIGSRFAIQAASNGNLSLMPSGGNVGINTSAPNMLFSVANVFGADANGHPYCDMRALGGGTGSATLDNTAWIAAAATCAGGKIYFPAGTYHNNSGAPWIVPAGTLVQGASENGSEIITSLTNVDIFECGSGANQTSFDRLVISGPNAVPTGTYYAINCSGGGNNEHFTNLEIIGTWGGIYPGGTNCTINSNRIESIMGNYMIYEPNGGCQIRDNQLDNNSVFNQTAGFGNGICLYNTGGNTPGSGCPGAGSAYSIGYVVVSNGQYFIATACSGSCTTGPTGGGLPVTPMYTNITDGNVTWQDIGSSTLTIVQAGTESWVADNDLTSPARYGIDCDGSVGGGSKLWARGNDIGGLIGGGVVLAHGCSRSKITDNVFTGIGLNGDNTVSGGYPIWDQNTNDVDTIVTHNSFDNIGDGSIISQSSGWVISANSINANSFTGLFYPIDINAGTGITVTGNDDGGGTHSPGVLIARSGTSRVTVVGNTFYGNAANTGAATSVVNVNNN